MLRHLTTDIEIDAPPTAVWAVLMDTDRYPEWNPFVTTLSAPDGLAVGAPLRVTLAPPGAKGITLKPHVVAHEPEHEFRWLGRIGIPRVFDGEHAFTLTALPDGRTHFVQSEQFRGVLVRPLWRKIGGPTRAGFEAMNAALAARVHKMESAHGA